MTIEQPASPLAVTGEAGVRFVNHGMRTLLLASTRGGSAATLAELSRLVRGWCVLFDAHGTVVEAAGAGVVHRDDARRAAFGPSRAIRHTGLSVHPIGGDSAPRGHLVVATRPQHTAVARELASATAELLAHVFFPRSGGRLEPIARADAVDVLLAEDSQLAVRVARRWALHSTEGVVSVLRPRSRGVRLENVVLDWLDDCALPPIATTRGEDVIVVLMPDAVDVWRTRVEVGHEREGVPVRCGLGGPAELGELDRSHRQALHALSRALGGRAPFVAFEEGTVLETVLRDLTGAVQRDLADVLAGLDDADPVLRPTLDVFLSENGSWESASTRLSVHRHTVRNRISRVEELTGLSFDRVDDRVLAWLALSASNATLKRPVPR